MADDEDFVHSVFARYNYRYDCRDYHGQSSDQPTQLYIQPDDLLFPIEYRGIGVRIEDDILVTKSGAQVMSRALPSHPDEVEVWVANLLR